MRTQTRLTLTVASAVTGLLAGCGTSNDTAQPEVAAAADASLLRLEAGPSATPPPLGGEPDFDTMLALLDDTNISELPTEPTTQQPRRSRVSREPVVDPLAIEFTPPAQQAPPPNTELITAPTVPGSEATQTPLTSNPAPIPIPSLDERLSEAQANLNTLLDERSRSDISPVPAAFRRVLAGATVGDTETEFDRDALSEPEVTALSALGILLADLSTAVDEEATLDPERALEALDTARRSIAAQAGLRLIDAALTTRVRGLSDYDPITKPSFLRGRRIRVLAYAEIERFASERFSPATSAKAELGEQYRSRIEVTTRLYNDADGLEVWNSAGNPGGGAVNVEGRRPMDRMHLSSYVELPPTLSLGSYRLKVEVRDAITGSVAERSIPLNVVADPKLATALPGSGR
ncbi:MAG: hypothetical protein AAGI17_11280 [Planctomycetota bacterium]